MHVITQDRLLCLNDGHARFITADALTVTCASSKPK